MKTMVTSLGQVYGVHSGVSDFIFDLNRKKMFVHLNYSPLLHSCLTMKVLIVFYSHNREGKCISCNRKGKKEKYITYPNEHMNHRIRMERTYYAMKTTAQGKHSSTYIYFRLHCSAFTLFF